jgi:parallel beta-helix repeat protein
MRSGPSSRWQALSITVSLFAGWGVAGNGRAAVVRVPEAVAGIQAAINVAQSGDTVMISPGTYNGRLVISGKSVTLASRYIETGDTNDIALTTITASGTILAIQPTVGAGTTVQGLTFLNGDHQVQIFTRPVSVLDCHFIGGSDQVSFEGGGGLVRGCRFFHSSDDGIDIDNASDPTVENNTILQSGNDGIEMRLHSYTGPTLQIVFRGNVISECVEDGIQLIDYPGLSSRDILIEGNVLEDNLMVGLGCMADGNTDEDFAGAPLVESVRVIGNTICGNPIGVTGGDNMLLMNNVIAGNTQIGVKRVSASSLVSHNLFWGNATHYTGSIVESTTTLIQDPYLDTDYHPEPGSPCIDAGAISILWNGKKVGAGPYLGVAPDLGAHEGPAGTTLSAPGPSHPSGLSLTQVRPNPSTKSVAISFTLVGPSAARIELVDLAGRKVLVRELGALGPGSHVVKLNEPRLLPAGVYVVRLVQGDRSVATPMVVAR